MLFKVLAVLRNFAVFIAAFMLVCAGIGALLPRQKVAIVTPKLDWMEGHADDYDVLFLGSSRTFRQIIPEVFDGEMAAAGRVVRSFNMGVDGMRPPEDTYILEKVLAMRTRPLRLVLVECNPLRLPQREMDRDTVRAVYWHDWKRMMALYRRAFLADGKKRNWEDRLSRVSEVWPDFLNHAHYWIWNASNLGRGHELLAEWLRLGPVNTISTSDLGRRSDGYRPSSDGEEMSATKWAAYEKELVAAQAKGDGSDFGERVSQEELRVKRRMIEQAGGQMVLVIPPYFGVGVFRPKPGGDFPPALDFSSIEKYPELFVPEHRVDTGHTNREGSEIYTRLIVRDLVPLLKP